MNEKDQKLKDILIHTIKRNSCKDKLVAINRNIDDLQLKINEARSRLRHLRSPEKVPSWRLFKSKKEKPLSEDQKLELDAYHSCEKLLHEKKQLESSRDTLISTFQSLENLEVKLTELVEEKVLRLSEDIDFQRKLNILELKCNRLKKSGEIDHKSIQSKADKLLQNIHSLIKEIKPLLDYRLVVMMYSGVDNYASYAKKRLAKRGAERTQELIQELQSFSDFLKKQKIVIDVATDLAPLVLLFKKLIQYNLMEGTSKRQVQRSIDKLYLLAANLKEIKSKLFLLTEEKEIRDMQLDRERIYFIVDYGLE